MIYLFSLDLQSQKAALLKIELIHGLNKVKAGLGEGLIKIESFSGGWVFLKVRVDHGR